MEIIYFMKIDFYVVVQLLNHVCLFVTPWTIDCRVPLFMEFPRQEDWSGSLFPTPGDLPGAEPMSLASPALTGGVFLTLFLIKGT